MAVTAHLKKAVQLLALGGLFCAWPPAEATGEHNYGPIIASDFKTFRVRMQTNVVIPAANSGAAPGSVRCILLRTWHAQPSYKPWSNTRLPLGAVEYSAAPTAKIEVEDDNRSTHLYWEEKKNLSPGQSLSFVSYFKVISPKRSFNPNTKRITWSDVELDNRTNPQKTDKNQIAAKDIPASIVNLTASLRSNHDPANTVKGFCQWIHDNIRYDASVGYDGDDVNATLTNHRGHCGHMITVLRHMCAAAGLKIRVITGLNLAHPNGRANPQEGQNPQPNAHLWCEIFFPRIGWIEVEPFNGEKCFEIPAGFIENNSAFQNYAVWYTESDNVPRQAMTSFFNGKYRADYGVVHSITFSEN